MKFNKWTLGLAAVGAVSLASAARADEKMNSLQTALSNTTISGYVSTSFNWAISPGGQGNGNSPAGSIAFQGQRNPFNDPGQSLSKQDGFNLDVVKLSISKPEDESPWASGYQVDLLFGPDAVGYNSSVNGLENNGNTTADNDFAIKQAYVVLRTPVGNGIDWKIGVFDTPIGYEVFDAGSNPNYTRSLGYNIEPTEHTGVLASYKVNDQWSFSFGVANTLSPGINARDNQSGNDNGGGFGGAGSDWHKTLMTSAAYVAPSSWGWAAGSSMYAGVVYGYATGSGHTGYQSGYQQNYYVGATLNTPWKKLTGGFAFDYDRNNGGGVEGGGTSSIQDIYVLGLYATFKATDKLSISGRAEYAHSTSTTHSGGPDFVANNDAYELTATVEYDMWANVVSRIEARFDHNNSFGNDEDAAEHQDSLGLYANIIYKF